MLILTEKDLRECVSIGLEELGEIEKAFASLAKNDVEMPPIQRLDVRENNGEIDVKSAYIKGFDHFAVKMSTGFFDNPKLGLDSGSGLMVLFNSKTGFPEALLLDNGYLTDIRTGIAGGIASKYLAGSEAKTVGIVGAGKQAGYQLRALKLVHPFERFFVFSLEPEHSDKFAEEMSAELGIEGRRADDLREMVVSVDILITSTPSKRPYIEPDWIKPGLHITSMGSDAENKNELKPEVLSKVQHIVCDRKSQCFRLGELHHAYEQNVIDDSTPVWELGEIISGSRSLERKPADVTLCDLTGTGAQDTAIANLAYKKALEKGLGMTIGSSPAARGI
jgi:ectoine utilization protein EutC